MSETRSEQTKVRTTHRTHDQDDDVSGRDHCEFPSLFGAPFSERQALTKDIDEIKSTVTVENLYKGAH